MAASTKYTAVPDEENFVYYPVKPTKANKLMASVSNEKQKRSCLKCSLYILLGLIFIFVAFSAACFACTYKWMEGQVVRFSVVTRDDLPVDDALSLEDLELVKDRVKLFVDTIQAGKIPADDLAISSEEVNGFIAHSDYLRGNAYVTLDDEQNRVMAQWSLPLKFLPGGKGRYFVASSYIELLPDQVSVDLETPYEVEGVTDAVLFGKFKLAWDDEHKLIVELLNGTFAGWNLPQDASTDNLMEVFYDCPDTVRMMKGIEGVVVENGALTVKARRDRLDNSAPEVDVIASPKTMSRSNSHWAVPGGRLLRKVLI